MYNGNNVVQFNVLFKYHISYECDISLVVTSVLLLLCSLVIEIKAILYPQARDTTLI